MHSFSSYLIEANLSAKRSDQYRKLGAVVFKYYVDYLKNEDHFSAMMQSITNGAFASMISPDQIGATNLKNYAPKFIGVSFGIEHNQKWDTYYHCAGGIYMRFLKPNMTCDEFIREFKRHFSTFVHEFTHVMQHEIEIKNPYHHPLLDGDIKYYNSYKEVEARISELLMWIHKHWLRLSPKEKIVWASSPEWVADHYCRQVIPDAWAHYTPQTKKQTMQTVVKYIRNFTKGMQGLHDTSKPLSTEVTKRPWGDATYYYYYDEGPTHDKLFRITFKHPKMEEHPNIYVVFKGTSGIELTDEQSIDLIKKSYRDWISSLHTPPELIFTTSWDEPAAHKWLVIFTKLGYKKDLVKKSEGKHLTIATNNAKLAKKGKTLTLIDLWDDPHPVTF